MVHGGGGGVGGLARIIGVVMKHYDAREIRQYLSWPVMIKALEDALRGDVQAPVRRHHGIAVPDGPEASLLLMPAWRSGGCIGVKLVTVFPGNAALGRRSVGATYLLLDGATGEALATMDGEELTARRTAAASAYASAKLSRSDASRLLMVGAGRQAEGLILAHASVRPIRQVRIWNRTPLGAQRLAAQLREPLLAAGVQVAATDDLAQSVAWADVVSCATLATQALVRGAWLQPGSHLDLVGAFRPTMRECDDQALAQADLIAVDEPEAALREGGDLVQAIAAGAIDRQQIGPDLRQLARALHGGRGHDQQRTVFKGNASKNHVADQ